MQLAESEKYPISGIFSEDGKHEDEFRPIKMRSAPEEPEALKIPKNSRGQRS
tara:strand:- start:101 stop:256 length:156 start_codon:yes stop_codon:yes gene_type:complete